MACLQIRGDRAAEGRAHPVKMGWTRPSVTRPPACTPSYGADLTGGGHCVCETDSPGPFGGGSPNNMGEMYLICVPLLPFPFSFLIPVQPHCSLPTDPRLTRTNKLISPSEPGGVS